MHDVTCSLSTSLDGYVVGPDGRFDWSEPHPEVFALATDEVRGLSAHLLGRRLYEAMLFWEGREDDPSLGPAEREFAGLWMRLPKVVFSTTLRQVRGTATRLATGTVQEEVTRLREQPGEGDIALGGAQLLSAVAAAGLVDEYRLRVYPVLVGGGTPLFPRDEARVDLRLVESRVVGQQVQYLRYRTTRPGTAS